METAEIYLQGISSERLLHEIRELIRHELAATKNESSFKKYLTIDEVAEFIGLSKPSVYRLTSRRAIPFVKIGSKLLFKEADITEWLDGQSVGLKKKKPSAN